MQIELHGIYPFMWFLSLNLSTVEFIHSANISPVLGAETLFSGMGLYTCLSLACWWTLKLVPIVGNFKENFCEHPRMSLSVDISFNFFGL